MLRIRLSRVGKIGTSSFRVIVTDRHKQAKTSGIEILGNYLPYLKDKPVALKKDRIEYWMNKGAIPTSSIASLLKKQGFKNMDKFLEAPIKKGAKKGEKIESKKETQEGATSGKSSEKAGKPEKKPAAAVIEKSATAPTGQKQSADLATPPAPAAPATPPAPSASSAPPVPSVPSAPPPASS